MSNSRNAFGVILLLACVTSVFILMFTAFSTCKLERESRSLRSYSEQHFPHYEGRRTVASLRARRVAVPTPQPTYIPLPTQAGDWEEQFNGLKKFRRYTPSNPFVAPLTPTGGVRHAPDPFYSPFVARPTKKWQHQRKKSAPFTSPLVPTTGNWKEARRSVKSEPMRSPVGPPHTVWGRFKHKPPRDFRWKPIRPNVGPYPYGKFAKPRRKPDVRWRPIRDNVSAHPEGLVPSPVKSVPWKPIRDNISAHPERGG